MPVANHIKTLLIQIVSTLIYDFEVIHIIESEFGLILLIQLMQIFRFILCLNIYYGDVVLFFHTASHFHRAFINLQDSMNVLFCSSEH